MADKGPQPLVINNFQAGIAPSPELGFADMRNLDNFSRPGVARLGYQLQNALPISGASVSITVNTSTDIFTLASGTLQYNGHGATGRAVTFTTSGTLPAPLATSTTYFVIDVSVSTFKVATTLDNALNGIFIDITTAGSGTNNIVPLNPAQIKKFAKDPYSGDIYAIDSNGNVWHNEGADNFVLITGNTLTNANGNGLDFYKNYLFAFRNNTVDVWGPMTALRSTRTWTNSFGTFNGSAAVNITHPSLAAQDDILYFGDRNDVTGVPYVGAISQKAGQTFDPTNVATYNVNIAALDLPVYKNINCLAELGEKLMIGTIGREIYPWDRSSPTSNIPILAAETNIQKMVTLNNILYFAPGVKGNIYQTMGSFYIQPLKAFPISISMVSSSTNASVGDMTALNGRLLFTLECVGCSGVYSLDIDTGGLRMLNQYSQGTYGTTNPIRGSALLASGSGDAYYVGWKDITTGATGLDSLGASVYYATSYVGYCDSQLYHVGNTLNKRSFQEISFSLTSPLSAGQGIRLSYRTNINSSFTVIGTYDYATYWAIQSKVDHPGIDAAEYVQIRCEMTTQVNFLTTPELIEVILS